MDVNVPFEGKLVFVGSRYGEMYFLYSFLLMP